MSSGLFFFLGSVSSIVVLSVVIVIVAYRRHRAEQRFAQALAHVDTLNDDEPQGKDLLSLTSSVSYGLLLRQAILERCEGIEDDDERMSFVDDMVEIAEAYGDGLVKRSKSSRY